MLRLLLLVGTQLPASDQRTQVENHASKGSDLAQSGNLEAAEVELRKAFRLAPSNSRVLGTLGTVLAMQKKFEESNSILMRALAIEPNNLTLRRYLAANLWQLHRYSEARRNLEIILKEKSSDPPTLLLLGMVAENMRDYATAARTLARVPNLVRVQPESLAALARSYYHIGNRQQARATIDRLSTHPAGLQPALLGAEIAEEMQDYVSAENLLLSTQSKFPHLSVLIYRLARVQYHAKHFDVSQRTLLGLIDSGYSSSDAYNLLGWCYQQQGLSTQAANAFEEAISLDPSKESNYFDLGKIQLANRSLPTALGVARRAAQAFPRSSQALLFKGSVELEMGQFTDAIDSYSGAVRFDTSSPDAVLGLANAQFAAGIRKDATDSFEKGIKQFPNDARFRLHYALMLLREAETGNALAEDHAKELLKSALLLDPSLSEAHYQLAQVALKKGRTGVALTQLEMAVKLDPQSSHTHFALARVYRRLGRQDIAAREMDLYQKLTKTASDPNPPKGAR